MADLLETGAAWLDDQRQKHMTRTVTYERGTVSVDVQATVGRSTFEYSDEYGAKVVFETRDYLIRTEDLVLDGQTTLPQRGDRIRETIVGQACVFEVMGPGEEPEWRYSDPYRRALRIHTKQVD